MGDGDGRGRRTGAGAGGRGRGRPGWAGSGGDAIGGWFGDAGVALDGVQGEAQSAGAVEQADALAKEGMDFVPSLAGGLLADAAGTGRVDGGPAGAWARTSARTLSHRFLHRCQRSLTCTASGSARRIASA